jgi:hypothetical protein
LIEIDVPNEQRRGGDERDKDRATNPRTGTQ